MKLIQLFKIHLICSIILVSFSFSRVIKPVGNEDMLKLVVSTDEGNKVRPYYLVDNNGIEYSDFKDFKVGDKVNFQIMSRTYVASNSNSNKKYQFELTVYDGDKVISSRDLNYKKKPANVTSTEKSGFHFTYAGYWFEDIHITKNTKIIIRSKIKGQKIYIRLIANKVDEPSKSDFNYTPVDSQKSLSLEYINDENKEIRSKGWYLVNSENKQEFMLKSNSLVRVFCRSLVNENQDSHYSLKVHENSQWIGNYTFDYMQSDKNAKIVTNYKEVKDTPLSKTRSFYLSVPDIGDADYSYYTFSALESENLLIKIVEYENNNK